MFAPRRSPTGPKHQSLGFKDVVLCENSSCPLTVPSALISTIWDQVNDGLRLHGGAEVGGLLVGQHGRTADFRVEEVVPIPIEYRFGPSFQLSPADLKGIEALVASIQSDPSRTVLGFYRSRTRNDSVSEESESAVLATLERSHVSFA